MKQRRKNTGYFQLIGAMECVTDSLKLLHDRKNNSKQFKEPMDELKKKVISFW